MHDELMVRVDSKPRKLGLQKVRSCSGSSKYEEVGNGTGPPIILDKGSGVVVRRQFLILQASNSSHTRQTGWSKEA
jgi:hypothetical protein